MEINIIIRTDGGSRGNPGEAAYGFVIEQNGEKLVEIGKRIGINTNNVAEYMAVLSALEYLVEHDFKPSSIHLLLDSQLIARQLEGLYKIKSEGLKPLFYKIQDLIKHLNSPFKVTHVPREQNKAADRMVNMALDGKI